MYAFDDVRCFRPGRFPGAARLLGRWAAGWKAAGRRLVMPGRRSSTFGEPGFGIVAVAFGAFDHGEWGWASPIHVIDVIE
jgi:hypothetical protein